MNYDLPDELRVVADGAIRTVIINRPAQLNAVNTKLHRGLAQVWRQISADTGARAVILTGEGRTFSRAATSTGSPPLPPIPSRGTTACVKGPRSSKRCCGSRCR